MKKKSSCCSYFNYEKLSAVFKALSDPHRLAMFNYLCRCHLKGARNCNVSELSTCCDVDFSGVSRHLGTLKDAGILKAIKQGKEVHYSLEGKDLAKTLRDLADLVDQCSCKEGDEHPTLTKGEKNE